MGDCDEEDAIDEFSSLLKQSIPIQQINSSLAHCVVDDDVDVDDDDDDDDVNASDPIMGFRELLQLLFIVFFSVLGGVIFGFEISIFSGAKLIISHESYFEKDMQSTYKVGAG
jgi:hypothetical protein